MKQLQFFGIIACNDRSHLAGGYIICRFPFHSFGSSYVETFFNEFKFLY